MDDVLRALHSSEDVQGHPGETRAATTTVTLERDGLTFVAKDVPAMVCVNCGEDYVDEQTTRQILRMAEEAAASGVQVDVRAFRAA